MAKHAKTQMNAEQSYKLARERYAALGVDTDKVLRALSR